MLSAGAGDLSSVTDGAGAAPMAARAAMMAMNFLMA
jgi:hypothetical protein